MLSNSQEIKVIESLAKKKKIDVQHSILHTKFIHKIKTIGICEIINSINI